MKSRPTRTPKGMGDQDYAYFVLLFWKSTPNCPKGPNVTPTGPTDSNPLGKTPPTTTGGKGGQDYHYLLYLSELGSHPGIPGPIPGTTKKKNRANPALVFIYTAIAIVMFCCWHTSLRCVTALLITAELLPQEFFYLINEKAQFMRIYCWQPTGSDRRHFNLIKLRGRS
jgi:hypothetical protein